MTDLDECLHGIFPSSACTICNGRDELLARDGRRRYDDVTTSRVPVDDETRIFIAQYDGFCSICHDPVHAGQEIAWKPHSKPAHVMCWVEEG